MTPCAVLVLAAGQGTRMRSHLPKVLHQLAGRPLLGHVLSAARQLQPARLLVVTGHHAQQIEQALPSPDITWVRQEQQLGTAHAVQCALPTLEGFQGDLLVLSGDIPLVEPGTLRQLLAHHHQAGNDATLLSTTIASPTGYGRVVRDGQGRLLRVVEEKDADDLTRAITEINAGIYCLAIKNLPAWLKRVDNQNAQGEYYLPDVLPMAQAEGSAGVFHHPDAQSLAGINNRRQLARLEAVFRDRIAHRLMDSGVTFVDPSSCWLAADVQIGTDTIVEPNIILGEQTVIGPGCHIGPFCEIRQTTLGAGCEVKGFCHLEGVQAEGPNIIGPYARLRPGTVLATKAKVGNFCEIKKSTIGPGSKVNHLSYIGDTHMAAGVNVGAGTITCNYDGANKHRTEIGAGVFIGSDTQLVAPVRIGDRAVIAAGTTVTKDVPADALAIARTRQTHIANWAESKTKSQRKK